MEIWDFVLVITTNTSYVPIVLYGFFPHDNFQIFFLQECLLVTIIIAMLAVHLYNNYYYCGDLLPSPTLKGVVQQTKSAKDYLIFTIIVMVIFGIFGGGIGAVLAIPALICSLQVSIKCSYVDRHAMDQTFIISDPYLLQARRKNDLGNYQDAKKFGVLALFCNFAVIIYHAILWIIVIVIIIVYATGGLSSNAGTGSSSSDPNPGSRCRITYTYYCVVTCGYKPRWTCD